MLWFQYKDDMKNKHDKRSCYDKYKMPLLVAAIVGLVLNLSTLLNNITLITTIEECSNTIMPPIRETFNTKNDIEQLIYTEMPNF